MNKTEIWKPIKGFEGYYEVSNMGNVKRLSRLVDGSHKPVLLKEMLLKPRLMKLKGGGDFVGIHLMINKKSVGLTVSRVVYSAFNNIELNLSLVVVNKDGNKMNNKLDNLKIITRRNVGQNKPTKSGIIGVRKQDGGLYMAKIVFCGKELLLHSSESKADCRKIYQLAKAMIDEYDKLKAGILSNSRLNNKLIVKSLPIKQLEV